MNTTIIDGQGGQLIKDLIKEISAQFSGISLTAVGTNTAAASAT